MRRVKQEHKTGCGIACVAMITDSQYSEVLDEARELFQWPENDRSLYTSAKQLAALLSRFDFLAKRGRMVRKWSSISDLAIVAINYNQKTQTWHWVVFERKLGCGFVYDPHSKSEVRTDFSRMRLRSYVPVILSGN
jgi:ABC-type bacteriocin/lantibiotic exporter with double-glycine peptidase domain